jgi:hypothetical protein
MKPNNEVFLDNNALLSIAIKPQSLTNSVFERYLELLDSVAGVCSLELLPDSVCRHEWYYVVEHLTIEASGEFHRDVKSPTSTFQKETELQHSKTRNLRAYTDDFILF